MAGVKKDNSATPIRSLKEPENVKSRAGQWGDLTKDAQTRVSGQIGSLGRNMRANVNKRLGVLNGPNAPVSADKERSILTDISPHVRNRSVTLSTAADRRDATYDRAVSTA